MTTKIASQRDLLDLVNRVDCTACTYRTSGYLFEDAVPEDIATVSEALRYWQHDGAPDAPRLVIVAQEPLLGEPWGDLDEGAFKAGEGLTDPGRWEYVVDSALVEALGLTR